MSYITTIPKIDSANIIPSTVTSNSKFILTVIVSELEVTLHPEQIFSNEIYSGEIWEE